MVWQEAFPPTGGPAFDAETERERRLAAQARAGATWALTALIARYQPTVVRYLTRLCGNQAQAQQMAERIFQRMERRLRGPHGAENLRLWLLRACTEAGLDTLRRPNVRSVPRLGGSSVAGLLNAQSGASPQRALRDGLSRLRKGGAVERQARPLVWADTQPPTSAHDRADAPEDIESEQQHLDEEIDRLDPRDALRHRLVRVTLAELPFGDAQCLALHLVAGLNQAEVARALGINNSAARRRIVHGLALFSDRYNQVVQSLGLPVELGYGDALPRAPMEPEPVAAPAPEPVVISAEAPVADERDERDQAPLSAEADDELVAMSAVQGERGRDILSGVSYLSEDGADDLDDLDDLDDEQVAEVTPLAPPAAEVGPVSGGLITRVASDAILGPIVDALPIESASPEASGVFGLPGPRSVPLAYELSSRHAPGSPDTSEIRMHWLDDTGMMTPLSFEAVVAPSAVAEPQSTDDEAPLSFEATAASMSAEFAADEPAVADEAPLAFELTPVAADDTVSPDQSAALGAGWEAQPGADLALVAEPTPPPPVMVPVTTPLQTPRLTPRLRSDAPSQPSVAGADARVAPTPRDERDERGTVDATDAPASFTPRPPGGVITRSLEDLWEEAPDGADF